MSDPTNQHGNDDQQPEQPDSENRPTGADSVEEVVSVEAEELGTPADQQSTSAAAGESFASQQYDPAASQYTPPEPYSAPEAYSVSETSVTSETSGAGSDAAGPTPPVPPTYGAEPGTYGAPDASQQYSAPGAGQYPAPDAGQQYGAPAASQQYPAPDAGQQYGAPAASQQYSAPGAGQYPAPDAGQQYSAPDAYGAPAAPGAPGAPYATAPGYAAYGTAEKPAGNGLAITALCLGIAAVVFSLFIFLAIPLGIAAIVCGIIARSKKQSKGMSLTGIITGAVGIVVSIIVFIVANLLFAAAIDTTSRAISDYESAAPFATDSAVPLEGGTGTVELTASVNSGTATVTYTDAEGNSKEETITGNWSESFDVTEMTFLSVLVTGEEPEQELSCDISVDGTSVQSDESTFMATCMEMVG